MNQSSLQPPLRFGTVLQSRYRVTTILGQGGFGRTYLAEDLGRFNELCAIKELIPSHSDTYFLEKSKELFQREAAILYQIQHPQIPQFRATFEQDRRLFLVQDYVVGKTYKTLLDERQRYGQTFSEPEIIQLLRQMLPVLAHIHTKGIIHRDISPDNIILRDDNKPVLIDFGVVKELATRFQSGNNPQPTTVGKLGYAPSEQIQTGRAYPCSDLYSLAVTAVVLLTGKEPQELFDDSILVWNWQQWVKVSPGLAQVLDRMLSYKPSDRYQSVAEVAKAFQAIEHHTTKASNQVSQTSTQHSPAIELSGLQTVAVGRNPGGIELNTGTNQPHPVIRTPKNRHWEKPWVFTPLIIFVAMLAGIGGWSLMNAFLNRDNQPPPIPQEFPSPTVSNPQPTPTPIPSTTLTPTPTPTINNQPITYSQSLSLVTGETTSVESSLKADSTVNYTFKGEQGQQLSASLEKEGILLTILAPSQLPIGAEAVRVTRYLGTLPASGEYTIQLSPVEGIDQSNYKLNLRLENQLPATPIPSPTESSAPSPSVEVPTVETETISFADNQTATEVSGRTAGRKQIKRYLVNVEKNQQLSVAVTKGAVTLDIRDPNGELLEDASRLLNWQGQVPKSGEYQIDVVPIPDKEIDFTLDVSVSKLE
jgi:serine/threonine protein kinase